MRTLIRRTRRVLCEDAGLSMIEIVAAAVIFFVVLTGVLGLLGVTTQMSLQAKQRTVLVNALNTYVERVKSLPFEQVDLVGNGEGVLPAEETTTVGGFTVTLRPQVSIPTTLTPASNPQLKRVRVAIEVRRGTAAPITYTTEVLVRDRDQFLTQGTGDPEPTIRFTASTPPEGTVVWGSQHAGGALIVGVDTIAGTGRLISSVVMWCDDQWILKNTADVRATWAQIDQETWTTPSFVWDTLQTENMLQPDGSYADVEVIPDGYRTVSGYVMDSAGTSKYVSRHFLVDNLVPATPGSTTCTATTNVASAVSWGQVMDGTTPAYAYHIHVEKQAPSSDTWSIVQHIDTQSTSVQATTASFSRYRAQVRRAISPRGLNSPSGPYTVWVSRPLLTGGYTITKSGNKYTVSVVTSVTPPAFPVTGTTTYRWMRTGSGVADRVWETTNPSATDSFTYTQQAPAQAQYHCTVLFTPYGYGANGQESIVSNRVGPTSTQAGTFAFSEGAWTW